MSVRTGFAIVGTAVGAYFGNASLGYAIGSMVGGYVDPVQVKGPRLTDAQTQTAQDGVPIPITYGSVRVSGNIIAAGKLQEHRKVDDGKGSGTETTTYYYTRTYAIGICEGPIGAIRRIWRDGKLVFDQTPASLNNYANRASTRQFLSHADIYLGTEDQMPNSALVAIFGPGLVPAHRGLAYVVIRDDDLTSRAGSIPSYEFEVVQEATPSNTGELAAATLSEPHWYYLGASLRRDPRAPAGNYRYGLQPYGNVIPTWYGSLELALQAAGKGSELMGWTLDYVMQGASGNGASTAVAPYGVIPEPQTSGRALLGLTYSTDPYSTIQEDAFDITLLTPELVAGGRWFANLRDGATKTAVGVVSNTPLPNTTKVLRTGVHTYYISMDIIVVCQPVLSCDFLPQDDWVEIPGTPGFYVDPAGQIHETGSCTPVTGNFKQLQLLRYKSATQLEYDTLAVGPVLAVGDERDTAAFWEQAYEVASNAGLMEPGLVYGADYPSSTTSACFCSVSTTLEPDYPILAEIVSDLCFRKGLSGTEIDVSQLTDEVKGFTIATSTTAADAINALAPAYQFDEAEWDGRIRFIKRGAATVAALNEDDAFDSEDGRIVETRAQELELPRKLNLAYMDVNANYAVTTQSAERLSVTVASSGTDQVQLSVVMDADKAAQTADILLKDKWSSINGTLKLSVGDEFSTIVPTDTLYVSYGEALFRCRAVEVENADGVVTLNLQQDVAGAYASNVSGVPPRPSEEGVPTVIGPTFAEVMNLPALRDQDDRVGLYVAACGPVGSWSGCQVALSSDGGATWVDVLTINQPATMGLTSSILPIWSEHIPDTVHSFNVALTYGDFQSVTLEAIYGTANALCVGEEILQFETETLLSPKNYKLGGMLFRGRKNTDPAMWPVGTRLVDLSNAYFLPLDRSLVGTTLMLRFTSFGTDTQYGTVKTVSFDVPKSVQEWPVTNIRHSRESDEALSLAWSPRHRLGTSRSPYPSAYFTGYRLVFTNGTITKIFDTSSQSFSYSAAAQVSDFGSAGTLTVTIYATNSILGPGEGNTVNV